MPAVLVEIAFLSNPEEDILVQDPLFRARVIEGIVSAVKRFQDKYSGAAGSAR